MDPTMQQAVSETPESPDPVTVEPAETEEVATNGEAESGAPVPTYDQQFPSLGGGAGAGPGAAAAPAPFGSWNVKPRVQSSTITQVRVFLRSSFTFRFLITSTSFLNYNHDFSPRFPMFFF